MSVHLITKPEDLEVFLDLLRSEVRPVIILAQSQSEIESEFCSLLSEVLSVSVPGAQVWHLSRPDEASLKSAIGSSVKWKNLRVLMPRAPLKRVEYEIPIPESRTEFNQAINRVLQYIRNNQQISDRSQLPSFQQSAETPSQIVARLIEMNLQFRQVAESDAEKFIESTGYHRLKGYFHPFYKPSTLVTGRKREFLQGIDFYDIERLYRWDQLMRSKVGIAIEIFEIRFRSILVNSVQGEDGFGYLDPQILRESYLTFRTEAPGELHAYNSIFGDVSNQLAELLKYPGASKFHRHLEGLYVDFYEKSSQFDDARSFLQKYSGLPPAWLLYEHATLGAMRAAFSCLNLEIQQQISAEFTDWAKSDEALTSSELSELILLIQLVRNRWAHNERLCDLAIPIDDLAAGKALARKIGSSGAEQAREWRLFDVICALSFLLGASGDLPDFKRDTFIEFEEIMNGQIERVNIQDVIGVPVTGIEQLEGNDAIAEISNSYSNGDSRETREHRPPKKKRNNKKNRY